MNTAEPQTDHPTTTEVLGLFRASGTSQYGREAVTQLEHALQAAFFAERKQAPPSLIVAALLHDVGHLLHALPEDAPEHGIDDEHEALAGRWLAGRFGPEVVEPVRLHVAAKRYLCAVEPSYLHRLSEPSQRSLELQGGPMTGEEVTEFESNPFCQPAAQLRRWDDAAKVPKLTTPPIEHFASYINQCAGDVAPPFQAV
jgi:phosphonate degradation associated HDIG domain protein